MAAMNYSRLAMAAVAATLADFVYGFLVYGNLLTASVAAQSGIYRSAEAQMANFSIAATASPRCRRRMPNWAGRGWSASAGL